MTSSPPILKLDEVRSISQDASSNVKLCHLYGIFLQEESTNNSTLWQLCDETCLKGINIKLCGPLAEFPKAKPGDIVRIHRLSFDDNIRVPIVSKARNVVVWSAFKYEPTPISSARNPSFEHGDNDFRKKLELLYCSMITRISELSQTVQIGQFFNVAGQIEEISRDNYNNLILTFKDGTGRFDLRVFPKKNELESGVHFDIAIELKIGDYFVVSKAKLDNHGGKLNLSANTKYGRSIRAVERSSVLGVLLSEALSKNDTNNNGTTTSQTLPPNGMITISQESTSTPSPRRRSPRFLDTQSPRKHPAPQPITPRKQPAPITPQASQSISLSQDSAANNSIGSQEEITPKYTKFTEIPKGDNNSFFNFYDFAGQVRGQPNETRMYNNWVFQLYDGSKPEFGNFYVDEVKKPVQDCVTILVYSNQKPNDTDKHIETVKKLNEGDLVFVKNVKTSWRDGKLKLEMNANLLHGKSINVIDKDSRFGVMLMDIVTNPFVDELREDLLYSTPHANDSTSSFE